MSINKQGKSFLGEGLSRRSLMKSSALVGLAAAAGGVSLPFRHALASETTATHQPLDEKVVWSA